MSNNPENSTGGIRGLLSLWFGVKARVGPQAYTASGVGLMLFKYGVEALVVGSLTGAVFWPWQFINPSMSGREAFLQGAPPWLGWAWFLWSLPFLWIAVTMSVRRAADAGSSPWLGLIVLVPIVNLLFMAALCTFPSTAAVESTAAAKNAPLVDWPRPPTETEPRGLSAATSIGLSIIIGGLMLWISVYLVSTYGASLFVGTPMLMGASASYFYNRAQPHGYGASMMVGLGSVFFAAMALMLFALEGFICIAMAAPLLMPIGAMGGLLGKAIADAARRPKELMAALLVLPLWAGAESLLARSHEYVVLTSVEIAAPPATVWQHVVDFPELTEPPDWYFRLGVACPMRARIEGRGPGAIRYCDFTTGAFVEPITAWNEPNRLAFNVAEQPDPMFELSPYRDVHPPHLHHYLRSTHGEFRLVETPSGGTRLEGRTWYKFDMFPASYWTLWSDLLIHRIHQRVLTHIKRLAEEGH